MTGPLTDRIRLLHILDAIAEVENYLRGVSREQFLANSEKRFATIKQIEIVGEACDRITEPVKTAHPEIPWRAIKGFRNISIHEYFGVNTALVWEIASNNLPELKMQIREILEALPE